MIMNHPQTQQIMERNPEISHIFNNPDLLRHTMEIMRNPAMLQEVMRNQDRALSNIESVPGGYNALRRMYTELQEPMYNAAQEQFGTNPFASLVSDNADSTSSQQGTENRDPLPNPWAPGGSQSPGSNPRPAATTATPPNIMGSPGMQSMFQQLTDNPNLLSNINTPFVQNMMQTLAANPEFTSRMISSNPLLADNPALQQQMRTMLPQFMSQLQNPENQSLMGNPAAIQAMMQIHQGVSQLQQLAPNIFNLGQATANPAAGSTTTSTTPSTTTTATTSSTPATGTTTTTTTGSNPPTTDAPNLSSSDAFTQLMANMLSSMAINETTGLFGSKPTGFGTTNTTTTNTFSFGNTNNMSGGSLFAQKPAAPAFGTTGTGFGTQPTSFDFGAGKTNTSSFNFGQPTTMSLNDPNNAEALQQAQQQIFAVTVNPFGDSPLFRNPIKDSSKETEVLKPTNPSAQKALLNDSQYKVALLPTAKIKPKPWSPVPTGKVRLFDGLEDEEPSLGTAAFLPKRSVKKLVLKNLNSSQSSLTLTSSGSHSQSTRIDVSTSLKNSDNHQDGSHAQSSQNASPLAINITDNNAISSETRTINVRQTSAPQAHESLPEPAVSKNLSVRVLISILLLFASVVPTESAQHYYPKECNQLKFKLRKLTVNLEIMKKKLETNMSCDCKNLRMSIIEDLKIAIHSEFDPTKILYACLIISSTVMCIFLLIILYRVFRKMYKKLKFWKYQRQSFLDRKCKMCKFTILMKINHICCDKKGEGSDKIACKMCDALNIIQFGHACMDKKEPKRSDSRVKTLDVEKRGQGDTPNGINQEYETLLESLPSEGGDDEEILDFLWSSR